MSLIIYYQPLFGMFASILQYPFSEGLLTTNIHVTLF